MIQHTITNMYVLLCSQSVSKQFSLPFYFTFLCRIFTDKNELLLSFFSQSYKAT